MKYLTLVASLFAFASAEAPYKPKSDLSPNETQFDAADIANIRNFKFDHVTFKTKKDCALDNYPEVSRIFDTIHRFNDAFY